jgi:signal transduction histidine kinase
MSRTDAATDTDAGNPGRELSSARIPGTDESDRRAHELNDGVIRHLFSAGLALSGFAAALDNPRQREQLLDCVDHIDATITRIRTVAFELSDRHQPHCGPW